MAEQVASELRRRIIKGELREGDHLPPEADLIAEFGVSRPTMREAVLLLEAESLIVVRRGVGGGARVQTPKRAVAARYAGLILEHQGTTVRDVYDARVVIETPSVGILARRRTKADLAQLRTALARQQAVADDPSASLAEHNEFHRLVVRLAGNDTLCLLNDVVQEIIKTTNSRLSQEKVPSARASADRKAVKSHRLLVDLIEARDADAAEALWRKHLIEAENYLLKRNDTATLDLLY
jgi:DNA-binding FadR family transcriptional regulator